MRTRPTRALELSVLAFVVGLALPVSSAAQARDPAADSLVAAWITFAGGAKAWDAVKNVRYTITTVWYDTTGAEQRRRPRFVWIKKFAGGFRVRVERTEAEGKYVQAWDGNRGAATLDGRLLPDTARAAREVAYVAGDLFYWIGLPWKLHDPGVMLRYLPGDALAAGRVVHVSFGTNAGDDHRDQFWYYFGEGSSPLPATVHYVESAQPDVRTRITFDRWGNTPGGRFIEQRTVVDSIGRRLRSLIVSDVKVNAGMADALFRLKDESY